MMIYRFYSNVHVHEKLTLSKFELRQPIIREIYDEKKSDNFLIAFLKIELKRQKIYVVELKNLIRV